MTITKHAKERLSERFDIKCDSEVLKMLRKFERDFIRCKTGKGGEVKKTIIWKDKYLEGVIVHERLITVIYKGWTDTHFLNKKNPMLRQGRRRHGKRNKYA